ncbi:MAG: GIY-YIG nuclease family protein [Thermoguttaceae bacterium]|nr:GIY-YIG nuclease family protein [Thermoguttaceae bacterium]
MREEEKARKEYEMVQREAALEESRLRKELEQARRMAALESASTTQRAKYEAMLRDLENKLTEAELKNQRAISMAQQTKQGNVYIISNIGSFGENVLKIGMTRRLIPEERVNELGDASVPFRFDIHAMIFSNDAPALETALHKHFALRQVNKVNHRKEFFRATVSEVRSVIESIGLTHVHWTMKSEAEEYRETQQIEHEIEVNPSVRDEWLARQIQLDEIDLHFDEDIQEMAV